MEIMTKEGVGDSEYELAYTKYKEDPEMYPKPEYQVRRAIVNFPYSSVFSYKIMETGDVEIGKREIKILTETGIYYTDYDVKVHKYLKECIEKVERNIDIEYGLYDPEKK